METRSLTFSGGLILGAGLMYLLDPERGRPSDSGSASASAGPPSSWNARLQCIAGALGVAAVAYGAGLLRNSLRNPSTSTAYDVDVPKYAWLR